MSNSSHNNRVLRCQKARAASFAQVFKALGSVKRLAILDELRQGGKTVGTLAKQLGVDTSTVSQHLQKLRHVNLVESDKHGLEVFCHITPQTNKLCKCIEKICLCISRKQHNQLMTPQEEQ